MAKRPRVAGDPIDTDKLDRVVAEIARKAERAQPVAASARALAAVDEVDHREAAPLRLAAQDERAVRGPLRPHPLRRYVGERDVLAPLNTTRSGYPHSEERNFGPSGLSLASDR